MNHSLTCSPAEGGLLAETADAVGAPLGGPDPELGGRLHAGHDAGALPADHLRVLLARLGHHVHVLCQRHTQEGRRVRHRVHAVRQDETTWHVYCLVHATGGGIEERQVWLSSDSTTDMHHLTHVFSRIESNIMIHWVQKYAQMRSTQGYCTVTPYTLRNLSCLRTVSSMSTDPLTWPELVRDLEYQPTSQPVGEAGKPGAASHHYDARVEFALQLVITCGKKKRNRVSWYGSG